jgi:SH3-like domain-containing protein
MYIWIMDRCAGGDPQAIAERAYQSGLKWVAIKIANGVLPYGKFAQNKAVVDALHAKGIDAWGWHYIYGASPTKEAEVAAQQVNLLGVDGYIINAEVEFKVAGMASAARQYMDALKRLVQKPIGLTSFRFPSLHREFPWQEFIPRVDFNQPQVYWIKAHNAGYQLRKAYQESIGMRANLPVIPLGSAFTEWGWDPTGAEILEFRRTANDLGLQGYGWWEWYHAETKNPLWWEAATKDLISGENPEDPGNGEDPQPLPKPELVSTPYANLRIRSGPSTSASVIGYMRPNNVYTVVEKQGEWGRLEAAAPTWVHLGYVQAVRRGVTKYSNLRVRGGPSLNAAVLGYLPQDVVHNFVDQHGTWVRLDGASERWVHLDYITLL